MEACIDGAHMEKKQLKLGLVVKENRKRKYQKKVKHNLTNYFKKIQTLIYFLVELIIIIFIIIFINKFFLIKFALFKN